MLEKGDLESRFTKVCESQSFANRKYPFNKTKSVADSSTYFLELNNDLELFGLEKSIEKWDSLL
jgi:hypothetical protein